MDRKYGLNTAGIRHLRRRQVCGDNWRYGCRYQGIDNDACVRALTDLDIRYEDFTFLDLGSEKGRALMLASAFPFHRIVGVEYCRALHRVAERNLLRFPLDVRRCRQIEAHWGDAAEFKVPDEPLVLFLYNPFGAPVMKKVIDNVTASFARQRQRIIVVYFCSEHADLWDAVPFLRRTGAGSWPAIFDTAPAAEEPGLGRPGCGDTAV